MNKPIGLIGGSFDPIHYGHLYLASEIQSSYQLEAIYFIPCHQNPLKSRPPYASPKDRIQMLQCALSPFKHFFLDLREISNKTPSYTIDTLRALRNEKPDTPFAFLMAFDVFMHFNQWQAWQEILNYTHLIVATRPGYFNQPLSPELNAFLQERKTEHIAYLNQILAGHIFLKELPKSPPISSTFIRHHTATQQDISAWVPAYVKEYIVTHRLYL